MFSCKVPRGHAIRHGTRSSHRSAPRVFQYKPIDGFGVPIAPPQPMQTPKTYVSSVSKRDPLVLMKRPPITFSTPFRYASIKMRRTWSNKNGTYGGKIGFHHQVGGHDIRATISFTGEDQTGSSARIQEILDFLEHQEYKGY